MNVIKFYSDISNLFSM